MVDAVAGLAVADLEMHMSRRHWRVARSGGMRAAEESASERADLDGVPTTQVRLESESAYLRAPAAGHITRLYYADGRLVADRIA